MCRTHHKAESSGVTVNGKTVTKLVFGCLFLHKTENAFALLDAAWQAGVTTFDCAAIYGGGECESILGKWLKLRNLQYSAVIITKGGCGDQSSLWTPQLEESDLRCELAKSLKRLQLTSIDIYMLHRDDTNIPVSGVVDMMNALIAEGSIHSWAVSNWTTARIGEAMRYAEENGLSPPNCSSIQLSLARPSREVWPGTQFMRQEDEEWYDGTGLPVLGWECLAKGFLTGGWDVPAMMAALRRHRARLEEEKAAGGPAGFGEEWREAQLAQAYLTPENLGKLSRLDTMAKEKGVALGTLALAWVMCQAYPSIALVGTTKKAHLLQAVNAVHLPLSQAEREWLEVGEVSTS